MITYLVELKLNIGGHEKYVQRLIMENTRISAGVQAMKDECHYEFGGGAEMMNQDECSDDFGDMIYQVYKITEVEPSHLAILKTYLK